METINARPPCHSLKDHEKLLRSIIRSLFESLVDEYRDLKTSNKFVALVKEKEIQKHISDTQALAQNNPCLWDLVDEMQSDLISEVNS